MRSGRSHEVSAGGIRQTPPVDGLDVDWGPSGFRGFCGGFLGGGPAVGRPGSEGFGGLGGKGEAGEQVGEVGLRVDPGAVAVADQGIERGGAVAAFGVADEPLVLFADCGGADGVFG